MNSSNDDDFENNEEEFKLIGLDSFFDTTDDDKINWEEFFHIKTAPAE